jgi:tetratricopeptide (TPR) repeat protein
MPNASSREAGLNLIEQGRIARLLGDLDSAEELYALAAESAADDTEVGVRSLIGRGIAARVRGNYPAARSHFQTALADALEGGFSELAYMGHSGLLIAAAIAGDIDTALVHGWAAFQLAEGDETRQNEMLVNLGQLALDAGYPSAAVRGFTVALSRTRAARLRLPAIGGAVVAAAKLNNRELVAQLRDLAEAEIGRSAFAYENAQLLRAISTSLAAIGDADGAESYRKQARQRAKAGGFFEIVLATEPKTIVEPVSPKRTLEKKSALVIDALEQMEPVGGDLVLATR